MRGWENKMEQLLKVHEITSSEADYGLFWLVKQWIEVNENLEFFRGKGV